MRIVILGSSVYSETTCAMAVRMAESGHIPIGALALSSTDRATLRRKLAQWGVPGVVNYARTKLVPRRFDERPRLNNPYLESLLKNRDGVFRDLREVAAVYRFSVATCRDQNFPSSIAQLRAWSPDLIIFTGGNILRKQLLQVPRLGVLNVHLGFLPEIRGMSSPEWSLLNHVPVGITIHYMDEGIDTGPILQRYDFPDLAECESLSDLRNRFIAFGVNKIAEVVNGLDQNKISATAQRDLDKDNQFFVMHEWLQARAAECFTNRRKPIAAETMNG
jgi:folate-dependent phosphoribosylglycinamide formyltransferase PurN